MGTGNTIKTGGAGIDLRSSNRGNSGENYYNKNSNPYTYGKVVVINSDQSIQYKSIEDNFANAKIGTAYPFYKNNTQLPSKGDVVPLLKGPIPESALLSQQYDKTVYYLNPISINQTVNDNTIVGNGDGNNNINPTTNDYKNKSLGVTSGTAFTTQLQQQTMAGVKNYLKNKNLSRELTAGIMGNIMKESSFNLKSGGVDTKGSSFGLISWNNQSYGFDIDKKIGLTVESQMDFLFNSTFGMDKFIKSAVDPIPDTVVKNLQLNSSKLDADNAAFLFAHYVEVCSYCNKTKQVYNNGGVITIRGKQISVTPSKRSRYAEDYYKQFSDPTSFLVW
jgi:hypothetical protein